jgi:CheY-like chemotaxis protein
MARTVLVVDDSPTIRNFARIYLKSLAVEVIEAEDGAQALAMVRKAPPDVCIVDVDMPNMDGLSFTREVRKDARPEIARLSVVLLTGDRSPGARSSGRDAGADDFLEKPIKGAELQAMVKKYLGPAA